MSKVDEITRENWILGAFPEWGTWLNEEIDAEKVEKGTVAMWWLGCTGIWVKSEGNANIAIDLWFGNGKRTKKKPYMDEYHQMRNMTGGRLMQPNLRAMPIVYDPFAVTTVDAVLSTHYHIDSFDRTCIVTAEKPLAGICPTDMDDKAVNYLIKTPGGNIYHSGDSHYSVYYAKHGKDHKIDVAFGSYGENPAGNQDKMTSVDILRMAEALQTEVVIPFHYDVWTNFKADPAEIMMLYNFKKHVLDYKFKPFIWDVGGKFIYPNDKDKLQYHYRRGFEDCFTDEPNVPFRSVL